MGFERLPATKERKERRASVFGGGEHVVVTVFASLTFFTSASVFDFADEVFARVCDEPVTVREDEAVEVDTSLDREFGGFVEVEVKDAVLSCFHFEDLAKSGVGGVYIDVDLATHKD